jgi:hypothetical protein
MNARELGMLLSKQAGPIASKPADKPLFHSLLRSLGRATATGLYHLDPRLKSFALRMAGNRTNLGALAGGLVPSTYFMMTNPNYGPDILDQGYRGYPPYPPQMK